MIAYKKFYHCKKVTNADPSIIEYSNPIEKYGNYQPLSGYVDIMQYGENASSRWRMFVPYASENGEYSENDVLYLDGVIPNTTLQGYENGDGANARITAVLPQNRVIRIELERIVER